MEVSQRFAHCLPTLPPRRSATLSWLGGSVSEDAVCVCRSLRRQRLQRSQEPTNVFQNDFRITPAQPQNEPRRTSEQSQNDPRIPPKRFQYNPRTTTEKLQNDLRTIPERPQNNPKTISEQPQNNFRTTPERPQNNPRTTPE